MTLTLLPDPYVPIYTDRALQEVGTGTGAPVSGANWPGANIARYVAVAFPADCTLYALKYRGADTTGNADIGLYDDQFQRLASSGSVANAVGDVVLTLPELRVTSDRIYWAAFAFDGTFSDLLRYAPTLVSGMNIAIGQESSAFPLPSVATPSAPTNAVIPYFAFGVR